MEAWQQCGDTEASSDNREAPMGELTTWRITSSLSKVRVDRFQCCVESSLFHVVINFEQVELKVKLRITETSERQKLRMVVRCIIHLLPASELD